jgi:hypothetical protein
MSTALRALTRSDQMVREAMACPALPMCGLAVTESERVIPEILGRVRGLVDPSGLCLVSTFVDTDDGLPQRLCASLHGRTGLCGQCSRELPNLAGRFA